MNALDVLCAQLTRELFATGKFLLTIGRLLLHCWYSLGRPVTIGTPMVIFVPFVKNSQKQSSDRQNSKNHHWCTNRHMSTQY